MSSYVNNQTKIHLSGATIADALNDLYAQYPSIKIHIADKNGKLRRYVNLFLNNTNIKDLNGIETSIQEDDKIILLPSISGG